MMYNTSKWGLAPEGVSMFPSEFSAAKRWYILRPEAVEGWYVLYKLTGDPKYQEWGWQMFAAIVQHCYTPRGWAGVRDVTADKLANDDIQQSFFLAETLKYLYLLFDEADPIELDQWVFNTEAHPIRVFDGPFEEWACIFAKFDAEAARVCGRPMHGGADAAPARDASAAPSTKDAPKAGAW